MSLGIKITEIEKLTSVVNECLMSNFENFDELENMFSLLKKNKSDAKDRISKNIEKLNKKDSVYGLFSVYCYDEVVVDLIKDLHFLSYIEFRDMLLDSGLSRELRRTLLSLKITSERIVFSETLNDKASYVAKKIVAILNKKVSAPIRNISFFFKKILHFKFKNLDDCDDITLSISSI